MASISPTLFILFLFAFTAISEPQFCQSPPSAVHLFFTQNQAQQLSLRKYLKGYNLQYNVSNPNIISLFQPYKVVEDGNLAMEEGYELFASDVQKYSYYFWKNKVIIAGQNQAEKKISIKYGDIKGNSVPKFFATVEFDFDLTSKCDSAQIINDQLDVALVCKNEQMNSLDICVLNKDRKEKLCSSFNDTASSARANQVFELGANGLYLASAALTQNGQESFVNIYNLVGGAPEFILKIDKTMLGIDSLKITDLTITKVHGITFIRVVDSIGKLVRFRYTEQNKVIDVELLYLLAIPSKIANAGADSFVVAVEGGILEYTNDKKFMRRYELEEKDTVAELAASPYALTVLTTSNELFVFDRTQTQYKYLLKKKTLERKTHILLSPYFNNLIEIDSVSIKLVYVSSGHILLHNVDGSVKDVSISATSSGTKCQANFNITFLSKSQASQVVKKKDLEGHRFESMSHLNIMLSDYFGGKNLEYDVKLNVSDMSYKISHLTFYMQQGNLQFENSLYKLVEINEFQFYFIAVNQDESTADLNIYLCSVQKENKLDCPLYSKQTLFGRVAQIDAKRISSEEYLVSWAYTNNLIEIMDIKNLIRRPFFPQNNYQITSIVIGDQIDFFVQKYANMFLIHSGSSLYQISSKDFTQEELKELGGFYPRQIFLNHKNPTIFHVKFPIKIVTMTFVNRNVQILAITEVSNEYIPDDRWTIIVGANSILALTPLQVAEYSVLQDYSLHLLQTFWFDSEYSSAGYSRKTNIAFVQTADDVIHSLTLGKGKINSEYYTIDYDMNDWEVSGHWIYIPGKRQFIYQSAEPMIQIDAHLPQEQTSEQAEFQLIVGSKGQQETEVKSTLTAINYPVKIKKQEVDENLIYQLPQVADKLTIDINISKFFTGGIADLQILCPYSIYKNISVLSPFRPLIFNEEVKGVVKIFPVNMSIVTVGKDEISLLNNKNQLIKSVPIDSSGQCSGMGKYKQNVVVFCAKSGKQELITFEVTDGQITKKNTYQIPAEIYIENVQDMSVWQSSSKLFVAIHDSNPLSFGTGKKSDIKVFTLGDSLSLTNIINSQSFPAASQETIYSMDSSENHLFVTLGSQGLGVIDMKKESAKGTLISLIKNKNISQYLLDDCQFVRVHISHSFLNTVQMLVTTSNSLNYLLSMNVNTSTFSVTAIYNRYGHERILNWAQVTDNNVFLSFYNGTIQRQDILIYPKSGKGIVDFSGSTNRKVSEKDLEIPIEGFLNSGKKDILMFLGTGDGIEQFNVTNLYGFLLDYDHPGNFFNIQLTAGNAYVEKNNILQISFDYEESSGLKWYAVVIMIALVLLIVGLAFGMYLRMKARKANKNASLVTETEELDEEI